MGGVDDSGLGVDVVEPLDGFVTMNVLRSTPIETRELRGVPEAYPFGL